MYRAPPSGNKINVRKLHLNVKTSSLQISICIIKSNVLTEAFKLL